MNRRSFGGALALTVVALLAGCASPGTTEEPAAETPSASASDPAPPQTSAPAPMPTSEAPRVDYDDPSSWIVSTAGFGPLALGASFADVSTLLDAHGWTIGCGAGVDAEVLFLTASVAAGTSGTGAITSMIILPTDGVDPHTAAGIGFDSALADVVTAYPNTEPVTFGQGYTGYRVSDEHGSMYFGARIGEEVENISITSETVAPMEYCG